MTAATATEARLEVTEAWLLAKHVTLWLDWDITDRKDRKLAAEYVIKMTDDLDEFTRQYWYDKRDEALGDALTKTQVSGGFKP